nr:MAG TPA: hypothetical protein [Caudoviricetes sp.]
MNIICQYKKLKFLNFYVLTVELLFKLWYILT